MKCKNWQIEKLRERLKRLYPLENPDAIFHLRIKGWLKKLGMIMAVLLLLSALFVMTSRENDFLQEGNRLSRPGYNEEEREVKVKAEIEGTERILEDMTLLIAPEKYTMAEFEKTVKEALPNLEKTMLGTNGSVEEVTDNLQLPDSIPDTPITIVWTSDKEEIISREGKVSRELVGEQGCMVMVTATFIYEEYKMSHMFGLEVKYRQLSEQEQLKKLLSEEIDRIFMESEQEGQVWLPAQVNGKKVAYEEKKQKKGGTFLAFLATGLLLWWVAIKEELENQEKRREKQLLMDYPELISRFTLLLGAGMTISGAWKRLVYQYEKQQKEDPSKKRRYVYEEMTITWREMQNGVSEMEAISRFGARVKLAPYLKFSTLLSQNIRKGSRGLTELLKVEGKLAYEERKENAKQQGEEAGTKLLFPMLMMLGIVLAVILVPAFLSFR